MRCLSSNRLEAAAFIESQRGVIDLDTQAQLRNPLSTCLHKKRTQKEPTHPLPARIATHGDRKLRDLLGDKAIGVIVLEPEAVPRRSQRQRRVRFGQERRVPSSAPPREQFGKIRPLQTELDGRARK